MALTLIVCGGSAYSADALNGTYVDKKGRESYSFSGDKLTFAGYGVKKESSYEIKDGKLIFTNAIGKRVTSKFKQEGNKLIIDGTEFLKK
ncbi:MAG: hypothetical protein FWG01_00780 [Betaproteobacteria bacterium]|nr:hypothetical protein [Betaproteobacteria bacterium]